MISDAARRFYSTPGPLTVFVGGGPLLTGVSGDPVKLRELVSQSLLHPAWAGTYGQRLSGRRLAEQQIRAAGEIARVLWDRSPLPLAASRSLEHRAVGTCRSFTTLYVALLRQYGVAARARCGFANYFEKGKWVDHWVSEYWSDDQSRWLQVDAQLDDFQMKSIGVAWSPDDLPAGAFLSGGECWSQIRAGVIDPLTCGIFDMWGAWFVRSNVIRDLAALNKIELLPWDAWGLAEDWSQINTEPDNLVIDSLAATCASEDLIRVQQLFTDDRFAVPETITSFIEGVPTKIAWHSG
jgi:hypothetical protein